MNIYIILLIISLIFIIIFLVYKLISINISLKEIDNKLNDILNTDTNNILTTSTNNKNINNFTNNLNIQLKKLREQSLEYQQGNNQIKRTITDISHDIRTPLTSIRGYTDLLKKEKGIKKQKEYLNIIDERVDSLINLTEQLFDYSKAIDKEDTINKENICLNDILEEIIISYYALFKKNNINPSIKICKNKIYKLLDKNMFIRIIENILSNSIKYSEGDLNIILDNNGKIISSNKTNKLDKTSVAKIFDRYYTVENAKKKSGIGLSIAKHLTELNQGNIKATYKKQTLIIEIEFWINLDIDLFFQKWKLFLTNQTL